MSTRGNSDIEWPLHPLVFELPDRRSPEAFAWVGHIPFAFWLVNALRPHRIVELGTHWGHSYFALCQAIASLGLDTEAFAIDSWVGDEHSGFYGEEVFSEVESWNSSHYGDFSSLQRMRFDEATDQFPAGTIDLLHIDGLHTYEAVRADFDSWITKVADGGIVLLHDTAERGKGFGVWRLLDELRDHYQVFEFEHGHGLGVVGVGSGFPPAAAGLFEAADDTDRSAAIRGLFGALGDRIERLVLVKQKQEIIDELKPELEHRQEVIDELTAETQHRQEVIDELIRERDARADEAAAAQAELSDLKLQIEGSPIARRVLRWQRH